MERALTKYITSIGNDLTKSEVLDIELQLVAYFTNEIFVGRGKGKDPLEFLKQEMENINKDRANIWKEE